MSNAFSFRLSQQETEWVLSQALPGETQHQTAQRLLRQLYTNSFNSVDNQVQSVDSSVNPVYNSASPVDNIEDIVDSRLQEKLAELESDIYARLADQLNATLDVRLGELSRGSDDELLRQQLAAVQAERDELDKECDRLTAKVGDLDLEKQTLAEELRQARADLKVRSHSPAGSDSVPNHSPSALPDAAELLQQLRAKNPKSKASLRDVEAILAAMGVTS